MLRLREGGMMKLGGSSDVTTEACRRFIISGKHLSIELDILQSMY